jgi:cephalosporin hydroxylase
MYPSLRNLPARFLARFCRRSVIDAFHFIWYMDKSTHAQNTFLGFPMDQLPMDSWLYQELLCRERPRFIFQTGIDHGGSLLYFATMLDLLHAPADALVIGVDIRLSESARRLTHPRIRLIEGSSTDPAIVARVRELAPAQYGLVSLDSDHSKEHVLRELELYSPLTEPGRHLVVEDCNVNGHPVYQSHGVGPTEAVDQFLHANQDFSRDDGLWRRNGLSFHQGGWLMRAAA